MKGVLLAGGRGMRLYPLTKTINKHIIPLGSGIGISPMILYPLWSLKRAGITEVLIITDRKDAGDIVGICGSGTEYGMELTYKFQDQAGGVAEALGLAEAYVGTAPFISILADNVFTADLNHIIDEYKSRYSTGVGCRIAACQVEDPLRYALIEETPPMSGNVIRIVEKPKIAISNLALTGIAIFDMKAFDYVKNLKPSARNELEYTDVLNAYIAADNLEMSVMSPDSWVDAGTFSGLDKASRMVANTGFIPFPEITRQDL